MSHLRHSFFISTHALEPHLDGVRTAPVSSYHLGAFATALLPPEGLDRCTLTFDTAELRPGEANPRQNTAVVDGPVLTVTGSDMNTQAIYYILADDGRLVVFNDLFLARRLLEACGVEPVYDAGAADLVFFRSLRRLRAGERLVARGAGGRPDVHLERFSDLLDQRGGFYDHANRSTAALREGLERAVGEAVRGAPEVHIALSGGIDSGTVASLVCRAGARLVACTLGTDWGDEYAAAAETAEALGVPLRRLFFGRDELRREIPAVIRFFHFMEPESVEIALVAHCLYKRLRADSAERRLFLTGYGSDLLNGGGITSAASPEALHASILRELARTQRSNEFSNLAALSLDVRVVHPFWHPDVISCALRVPPTHKCRDGQDKYYLRRMMDGRLPAATVGRAKLGAHRGTGLSQHLAEVFQDHSRESGAPASGYAAALARIHREIFQDGIYEEESSP